MKHTGIVNGPAGVTDQVIAYGSQLLEAGPWCLRPCLKGERALMVTIFIVDDEAILHRLYKDVFAIKGHQVVADAYDGEEAVRKFTEMNPRPDVIILDHRMPNKDGLEAMKEILNIERGARIVFISADANVREQAIKNGAASFGLKPVTIRHMLDLVESAVNP